MKGNEVFIEAGLRAGCKFYAGYPITPQNEAPEYMSRKAKDYGAIFMQAESELSAISMIFGAASAGFRCMTSSSSPGISLQQEGLSYIAGAELPCVVVNIMRGGPGLGNIRASQADYLQSVKGGGHGGYHLIVLAPHNLQELYDLTMNAFDYADSYRNPVLILGDGILGQMSEPVLLKPYKPLFKLPVKDYVTNGCKNRSARKVSSLFLNPVNALEQHNINLHKKYDKIKKELNLVESINTSGADLIIVAYGITARVCKSVVELARKDGLKVGLVRPISLWPFPSKAVNKVDCSNFLVVEMSEGQLIEDVKLSLFGKSGVSVSHFGHAGGWYPTPEEILAEVKRLMK